MAATSYAPSPATQNSLRETVLAYLDLAGDEGLTTGEIAELADIERDSLSPRMKSLVDDGLVRASGTRIPQGRRRAATVWKLV